MNDHSLTHQSKFGDPHGGRVPGILLWQASKIWQQQLNLSLTDLHLSSTNAAILTCVLYFEQESKIATQKDIALASKVDVMTTSQAIRTLEKKGFLVRSSSTEDKRAYAISLTDAGRTTAREAIKRFMTTHKSFFKTLDAANRREAFVNDLDELLGQNAPQE